MVIDSPFAIRGQRKGTGTFFDKPFVVIENLDTNEIKVEGSFNQHQEEHLIVSYLNELYKQKLETTKGKVVI